MSSTAVSFKSAARQQESFLRPLEKPALLWLAGRMPAWVTPDHLTILGFLAMTAAGISYALARQHPLALLGAVGCLGLNWFGDSLDGTLARFREKQRPRYGFYVDHIVDTFGALFLFAGMGLSGYMTGTIAMAVLIAYFMLSIEIYLATYTMDVFRLSFAFWGPTELRLVLMAGTLVLYVRPRVMIAGHPFLLCDVGGVVAIIGMITAMVVSVVCNTRRLYLEERIH